jgi:multicomponent K+:H+ antiporter subunit F
MNLVLLWSLRLALTFLVLAMLCALIRLIRGPSAQDRVTAFDCLYLDGTLLILTLGLTYRSTTYFEAALLVAIFGFVGTTAMAKFLLRGEVIE